ncbi:MAG: apolipoprotein N-acyltransferase [Bacteroidales bacterium]|jgi:apolipoprotein N-acyltransferase|nr:apolipoprotein N-acyltransferase [Bacteroidales bacterium]
MNNLIVQYRNFNPLTVALQTALLLIVSWYPIGFPLFLLYAFVPLLLWEEKLLAKSRIEGNQTRKVFLYSFIAFSLFNLARGWWVAMSGWFLIVLPFFNAMLMALVFVLYHLFRLTFRHRKATILMFPVLWVMFENINTHWDLNFPWFNLGNGFANYPMLVQWYELTGASGGTLWITLTNAFIAIMIISIRTYEMYLRYIAMVFLLVFGPVVSSLCRYWSYTPDMSKPVDVVLLQPNLDPYKDQYSLSADSVSTILLNMAKERVDKNTDYVVAPESCLQEYAWEERLSQVNSIQRILDFNANYPRLNWIAGMSTRHLLPPGQKTEAARYIRGTDSVFYECSNVALQIGQPNQDYNIRLRRKSYLTPGVEKMPFKKYIPFMEKLALNMGGTVGTLAKDSLIFPFYNTNTGIKSGVSICYESVEGNLVRKFVLGGAEILFCITNDGWWGNTQGYRQHKAMSRLRAIENRRYVCRAANTGTSIFIDPSGNIIDQSAYWKRQSLKATVYLQENKTFYAKHGDYIIYIIDIVFAFVMIYVPCRIAYLRKKRAKTQK